MSSLHGPEGRENKNGESAARSTMDAESEDVMEDRIDEIDEEGTTQCIGLDLAPILIYALA